MLQCFECRIQYISKKIIFLLLVWLLFDKSFAQSSYENLCKFPQTPSVASLLQASKIPVSGYSGLADISIPIFSTEKHNVPLTVQLSYNSSGVKVNEIPGVVGHNWSLLAGGVIIREQHGEPDEWEFMDPRLYNYDDGHIYKRHTFVNYFHSVDTLKELLESQNYETILYEGQRDK